MKLFKYLILASITVSLANTYYPNKVQAQEPSYENRNFALNDITDTYFSALHTGINQIKSHQTTYKKEWLAINRIVNNNLSKGSCGGDPYTDPNAIYTLVASDEDLTDAIFYARHPELNQRSIRRDEYKLINEWKSIHDKVRNVFRPGVC